MSISWNNGKQSITQALCLFASLLFCLWSDRSSVHGFTTNPNLIQAISAHRTAASLKFPSWRAAAQKEEEGDEHHPMSSTSFLSHVMLKVPSVDKTVKYWTEKGGTIRISKAKPGTSNGEAELLSAFLELGCPKNKESSSPAACFALELVATEKENYSIGNAISYIGVSMLLQFQNNLLGAITGDKPASQGEEPNGILVKSAASAPGDFLARFALKSQDLASTFDFYANVLGMEAKAQDDEMLCLRYDNECFSSGVPTTLIFDAAKEDLDTGDCFDHLAITTKTSIDEIFERTENQDCTIFMKPTEMFGKNVMGVIDPNGYKVVIASQ